MFYIEWTRQENGSLLFNGAGIKASIKKHTETSTYILIVRNSETSELIKAQKNIPCELTAKSIAYGIIREYLDKLH